MAPDAGTDAAGGGTHEDENGACSEKLSVDDSSPPPPMFCALRNAAASEAEWCEFADALAFAAFAFAATMASDELPPIEPPRALPAALELAPTPNAAASLSVMCIADSGRGARLTNRSNTSPPDAAAVVPVAAPEDAPAVAAPEGRDEDSAATAAAAVRWSAPESAALAFSAEF